MRRRLRALAVIVALLALTAAMWRVRADTVANRFYAADVGTVLPLADAVAASVARGVSAADFATGSEVFDGEWALVTCQMALLGLGQVLEDHPERRQAWLPAIRGCGSWLLTEDARAFGAGEWGEDGFDSLASDHGHAYLGWLNLGLGMAARAGGDPDVRDAHDRLTAALARRLDELPVHRLETYPGEVYPPDIAAVAGSVGLHGGYGAVLGRWEERFRAAAVDPDTGLLRQALRASDGAPADAARGSGTCVASYFLSFATPRLSRDLALAARTHLDFDLVGLGGVREVPRGRPGRMDIDSGPVLLGVSVSATGFGLAASRVAGDAGWHRRLYRTAHLFGMPTGLGGQRWFWTGGSLGNAILLAMLTAKAP